ncbi:hypothetical protein [Nocardia nepalensis]|uniref:hypothetical protein n=1 Tax=Nocardia nepalensis TaxID=3375448 RepID=UPI003B6771EB
MGVKSKLVTAAAAGVVVFGALGVGAGIASADPPQGPESGQQCPPPGDHQGPPPGDHQGPPPGDDHGPPPGDHQGPPPGDPQGPPPGCQPPAQ